MSQQWDKRQRLFEKVFAAVESEKATASFWAYITRELGKLETNAEEWRSALVRCIQRHPRTVPTFDNKVSDAEVDRLLNEGVR